jgi:hypothetical protein
MHTQNIAPITPLTVPRPVASATLMPSNVTQPAANIRKELGKYMLRHTKQLRKLGWTTFIKQLQHPSDINPAIRHIPHPAAAYLHRLAHSGTPAPSTTPPWTRQRLKEVYQRGAHSSAMHQFRAFLFEDMWDMIRKRYWVVLPFSAVQHFKSLKLAPAGVVPQQTRRP